MDDLNTIQNQYLIEKTRRSRNTNELIKWLRTGGLVTPELSMFIADILAGEVKASPKKIKFCDLINPLTRDMVKEYYSSQRFWLKAIFDQIRSGQKIENWQEIEDELKAAGYIGELDKKGEITEAARLITAKNLRYTLSQLDEILINRERQKTRKK